MTWVRIDDRFAQHPKVVSAGPLAMAMQVAALGYCNRELTDGFIPRAIARTLLDFEIERDGQLYTLAFTCGMAGDDVGAAWVIEGMVESGMWEEVAGGYRIHDYHDYQPTREQVLHERELTKQRVSAFRQRNSVGNAVTNADSNGSVTPSPVPTPTPVPVSLLDVSKPSVSHPPARGEYTQEFEEFWKQYPRVLNNSKAKAFLAWDRMKPELRSLALAGLAKYLASDGWQRGFAPHTTTYLNGKLWQSDPPDEPARASPNGKAKELTYYGDPEEVRLAKAVMAEQRARLERETG